MRRYVDRVLAIDPENSSGDRAPRLDGRFL